jgi:hypothetical protein
MYPLEELIADHFEDFNYKNQSFIPDWVVRFGNCCCLKNFREPNIEEDNKDTLPKISID